MKKWSVDEAIEDLSGYITTHYEDSVDTKKTFYHYTEWSRWRFYLKAIRHRDWKSLIGHVKSHFV